MHIYRITDGDEKHIGNVNINLKRYSSGQPSRNWYRVVDMVFLLLLFVEDLPPPPPQKLYFH